MDTELTSEERESWINIWNEVYDRHYRSYFEELRCERLISTWNLIDTGCRILIAITTSGSAISGWALWEHDTYRTFWTVFAGITAVVAVIYSGAKISEQYRDSCVKHADFRNLRLRLEDFMAKMRTKQYASYQIYKHEFSKLMDSYSDVTSNGIFSVMISDSAEGKIQEKLNKRLGL